MMLIDILLRVKRLLAYYTVIAVGKVFISFKFKSGNLHIWYYRNSNKYLAESLQVHYQNQTYLIHS
jgi:hypothetical protein